MPMRYIAIPTHIKRHSDPFGPLCVFSSLFGMRTSIEKVLASILTQDMRSTT